jgi:pyruvate formate lyase activating enzyme
MTAGEVFRKIRREEVFFRYSGGGVTFSGGEPFAQLPFLRALTRLFGDAGIDMWIETSGHFSWDEGADIFSNLSHVFLDLKCMDPGDHRRYTGQDNGIILANAVNIYKTGIPLTIRIPCVKNLNFTEKNLRATAGFMKEALPGAELEFLPYHDLGKEKYSALGMESFFHQFSAPGREELMWGKAIFQELGLKVVSYS